MAAARGQRDMSCSDMRDSRVRSISPSSPPSWKMNDVRVQMYPSAQLVRRRLVDDAAVGEVALALGVALTPFSRPRSNSISLRLGPVREVGQIEAVPVRQ